MFLVVVHMSLHLWQNISKKTHCVQLTNRIVLFHLFRLSGLHTHGRCWTGLFSKALYNLKHLEERFTQKSLNRVKNKKMDYEVDEGKQINMIKMPDLQKPFDHVFLSFKRRKSLDLGQQQKHRLAVF